MPSRESDHDRQRIDVAGPAVLGDAVAAAHRYATDQGLGPSDEARLCIIVEELIANMIEHGGVDVELPIGIEFCRTGSAVSLVIEDQGPAFDPRLAADESGIPARGGGAGLRLVRAWSDIIEYHSANGRNRIQMSVRLSGS